MTRPAEVSVNELAAVDDPVVVDVREPYEFASVHIPGARSVPLGTIPERHGELPADATVYLVCAVGARSMQAAMYLDRLGFDVRNVAGGTQDWIDAGFPVESGPPA